MVPERFHTPMRAPTARRMKTALVTEDMAVCADRWTSSQE